MSKYQTRPRLTKKSEKGLCRHCNEIKNLTTLGNNLCNNCSCKDKRKHDPYTFLRIKFKAMTTRCNGTAGNKSKQYKGKFICTRDQFINKFIKNENFLILFKKWQESNWNINCCPSIDRIDNDGDYNLENLQMIVHVENCIKDKLLPVNVYDRNGNFIKNFVSVSEAARQLGVFQPNANKVVNGQRPHTGGYVFKYVRNENE